MLDFLTLVKVWQNSRSFLEELSFGGVLYISLIHYSDKRKLEAKECDKWLEMTSQHKNISEKKL